MSDDLMGTPLRVGRCNLLSASQVVRCPHCETWIVTQHAECTVAVVAEQAPYTLALMTVVDSEDLTTPARCICATDRATIVLLGQDPVVVNRPDAVGDQSPRPYLLLSATLPTGGTER
jgi:hypothetical protein